MSHADDAASSATVLAERLRQAQAVAQVGSWELDLATRMMWASEEAFRIYGFAPTPDQLLPLDVVQSMALSEYRPPLDAAMADLVAGRALFDVEYEIRRANDGAQRAVRSRAKIERPAGGAPAIVVGTVQDITDRKAIEDALRASEQRCRMIVECSADAIFFVSFDDSGLRIIRGNNRASELTGYTPGELAGSDFARLFSPAELAREPLRPDLVHGGEPVIRERTLTRKDGSTVSVELHSVRLPDGNLQSIVRDISERRRLEEQVQRRQRVDSVAVLASGFAHDFNNILVSILGNAELLRDYAPELTESSREAVQELLQGTRRAADLVRRLQALTRPDPSADKTLDLHRVVTEALQAVGETTGHHIRTEVALAPDTWFVRGSGTDLHHALVDLGLNAVQAIEAKGEGDTTHDLVRIDAARYDAGPNDRLGLAPGEYVHLRLSDTGIGMSTEVRQRAFDPLFSTKQKGVKKGQGLGLTMVYRTIVEQHHGAVDVETTEGRGSVFHLYLPAGRGEPRPAAAPTPPAATARGTVLVVEDEEMVATLACRILTRAGYHVLVAADGVSALDTFAMHASDIGVVLLDQTLPKLSGLEVMARILRTHPEMPILLSSGDRVTLPADVPATVSVLPKPYSGADLTGAVRKALG